MITLATRLRLAAFAVIAVIGILYVLTAYVGLGNLLSRPYTVDAEFRDYGGIFPGAEVDERGVPVGTVGSLTVVPDGVRVQLKLDKGTKIPDDLTAAVTDRSALGEQYVDLTPNRADGPYLHTGSSIALDRTTIPLSSGQLVSDLSTLTTSLPPGDIAIDLEELGNTFSGLGPDLQSLVDSTRNLSQTALADIQNTIALLHSGQTVLDTQVASSASITQLSQQLASLTTDLRTLNPTLVTTFASGIQATAQVTTLLADNAAALPSLLDSLITVNSVAAQRLPALRKVLVVFPYDVEGGLSAIRSCDDYDTTTGQPIASTCHTDPTTGLPVYSLHLGLQLPDMTNPCTQGYQGTTQYLPNGQPTAGTGPAETFTTPANPSFGCTAAPTSSTPDVRGVQNVQKPGVTAQSTGTPAVLDPVTGTITQANGTQVAIKGEFTAPPATGGLAWLLLGGMTTG